MDVSLVNALSGLRVGGVTLLSALDGHGDLMDLDGAVVANTHSYRWTMSISPGYCYTFQADRALSLTL